MRSHLIQDQRGDAWEPGNRILSHGDNRVRTDTMMKTLRNLLACLGGCCLFLVATAPCQAQPYPGPPPAYAGGLPWDMRQQYYEQLPSDRSRLDGEMQSPLDRFLRQVIQESWFQLDYLQWNFDDVPDNLVGATVLGVERPDLGFTINDTTTGAPSVNLDDVEQINYTPRLGLIDLNDQSGLRLTYGLETNYGTLESSAMWILQNTRRMESTRPFPYQSNVLLRDTNNGVVALPFSQLGQPATEAIIADRLRIGYDTSMFGAEINFISDDNRPINGFHFRPVVGVRYTRLEENMSLHGRNDATLERPQQDTNFFSNALNQMFGPQVGFKSELKDDYFTLGAKTAFTFGFNHVNTKVVGNNPQNPYDATQVFESQDSNDLFAPMVSLSLYTQIRLMERVKLYGAYELLYIDSVSRAYETITYDIGPTFGGFTANKLNSQMFNQGFNVGLLFDF